VWAAAVLLIAAVLTVARIGYPLRHESTILSASFDRGLDPYLTIAVICVESRFQPSAVSSAGAVGLMQLMPETAVWIATQREQGAFHPAQLVDPEINVTMGTWYLAYLRGRYEDDVATALAAYNAGPTAVDRWLAAGEPIPTAIHRYVRRVLGTASRYRFWYGAPLLGALLRLLPW
jgi:soluble lytic murein transglycosylase